MICFDIIFTLNSSVKISEQIFNVDYLHGRIPFNTLSSVFGWQGIIIGFLYGLLYQFINKCQEYNNYNEQTINEKQLKFIYQQEQLQLQLHLINGTIIKN
ncbi:unnamed protein product [Paramecium pentaurelia]|uniref:Transmembrane protein n=1 Tax=Paramecium pentaurelia TaxID=43138 RepID=A0A8S1UHQ2_9CILI|nr:unnamed protein product [Paramecium pentaurelia]